MSKLRMEYDRTWYLELINFEGPLLRVRKIKTIEKLEYICRPME